MSFCCIHAIWSAGQFDAQDGPGSVEAWTTGLEWPGRVEFYKAKRHIWRAGQDVSKFLEGDADMLQQKSHPGLLFKSKSSKGLRAQGQLEKEVQRVAGYWKHHGPLTSVVLKDAGHMVPRDQPLAAQTMVEAWVQHCMDHDTDEAVAHV